MRKVVIVLLLLPVLGFGGCNLANRLHALQALPDGTGAWFVTYAYNRTFGFGPGGNETGFNVVLLSDSGAERVAKGGATWHDAQPGGRVSGNWRPTPIPRDETWMGRDGSAAGTYPAPTVRAFLDQYGFGSGVSAAHQQTLDTALNAPGNYYAFGRGGLLVVIVPQTRRAYVLYAG